VLDLQLLDVWREVVGGQREGDPHPPLRFDRLRVVQLVPGVRELVADAEGAVAAEAPVELPHHPLPVLRAVQGGVLDGQQHVAIDR
jgi:hypothetical protein